MAIGKRIKQARENTGMSREQLAARIEVTPSAISNYENDISHPKEPILYKLIEVLRVDANFLFQDSLHVQNRKPATPEGDGLTEDIKEINSILDRLGPDERKEVLKFVKYQASEQNQ